MLLVYVAVALITLGFVVPCVIDVAMTPRHDFGMPTKRTWLLVVILFWAFGAAAWLIAGRRDVRMRQLWFEMSGGRAFLAQEAHRRHPAARRITDMDHQFVDVVTGRFTGIGRTVFVAPDDNPEFLRELDRRIRERREDA